MPVVVTCHRGTAQVGGRAWGSAGAHAKIKAPQESAHTCAPAWLRRGLGVTILEIMPYAALQFGVYDLLMRWGDQVRVSGRGG